jgi:hypothetical protein
MTALDELEKTLAAGPDLGIITLRKSDVLALLSAAREGERLREALTVLEAERKREDVRACHLKRAIAVAYADMLRRTALQS